MIRGIATLEDNSSLCADEVREALLETNATNEATLDLLKLLFGAFAETTQRLLLDHLPELKTMMQLKNYLVFPQPMFPLSETSLFWTD